MEKGGTKLQTYFTIMSISNPSNPPHLVHVNGHLLTHKVHGSAADQNLTALLHAG